MEFVLNCLGKQLRYSIKKMVGEVEIGYSKNSLKGKYSIQENLLSK